jgi:hypothetical protein
MKSVVKKPANGYKWDFDKILPEICEEYIDSDKSIKAILEERGGPEFSYFYRVVWGNSEYREMWFAAERGKAASLDDDFVEIQDKARVAYDDKGKNANALKIMLEATKVRRGQLDAKFRDREVKHTHEAGDSWRQVMTEGRARLTKMKKAQVVENEPDSG